MKRLLELLEQNTDEPGSFTIEYNQNREVFMTVADHLDEMEHGPTWINKADKDNAIERNQIVEIYWHRFTSVAYHHLAASSLTVMEQLVELMVES